MNPAKTSPQAFLLPQLKATFKITPDPRTGKVHQFWDVKFYPFGPTPEAGPIFAAIDRELILIGRVTQNDDHPITILHTLGGSVLENDTVNSCTWCYINYQEPLLAVSGESGQIKILNALSGTLFTTFVGHGNGTVNDLATNPVHPWIIASASMDSSIRIWDLRRWKQPHESPCVIICGHGLGHKEGLLTVSWHDRGRYLISGGHDHRICVWTLPDLSSTSSFWNEIAKANRKRSSDEVRILHFPHFVSTAVHTNYVDCARFLGDIVVSKAADEDKLVIWRITGFNSRLLEPSIDAAPKTGDHLDTRNGFMRRNVIQSETEADTRTDERYETLPPYEKLFELSLPACAPFYIRFGLLKPSTAYPDLHPIVVAGNTKSQILFWDLDRFEFGHDGGLNDTPPDKIKPANRRKLSKTVVTRKSAAAEGDNDPGSPSSSRRSESTGGPESANPGQQNATANGSTASDARLSANTMPVVDRTKYPIHDPHLGLKRHKEIVLTDFNTKHTHLTTRAIDWSMCGRWCVAVGESAGGTGVLALFARWEEKIP